MKKFFLSCMIAMSAVLLYAAIGNVKVAEAATGSFEGIWAVKDYTVDVGDKTFYMDGYKEYWFEPQQTAYYDVPNLVVKQNGKTKTIDKNVMGAVTDKKVIYYAKLGATKSTIYRYNIKTGKRTKVFSSKVALSIYECSGDYLYYGTYPNGDDGEGRHANIYSYGLNNGKKRHLADGISSVTYHKGSVLLHEEWGGGGNFGTYVCKENGTNVKKLSNSLSSVIKGNRIYCVIADEERFERKKVVSYSLNGTNKKTVVNWTTDDSKINPYYN